MYEENEVNRVVGYIYPYGSYALGVSAFDSDMDLYLLKNTTYQ